jgi:hypothetical protein
VAPMLVVGVVLGLSFYHDSIVRRE